MTNADDERSIVQRAIDFAFGKPEAHQPTLRMNRKQRRIQRSLIRKRQVVNKRKKHEGRG